jgi:putative peptidoglycan lipid II flippase
LPACAGLVLLAEPLMITLFQYDQFTIFAAYQSSLSLMAYGSGLMAFIMVKILAPVFLARGDTKTPVKAGVVAMLSNVVLNIILGYYYDHVGLAVATSVSALINGLILYYYLNKQSIFAFSQNLIKMFFKVLLASFIMVIFILNFDQAQEVYINANAFARVNALISIICLSAFIYFLSLRVLGVRIREL